MVSLNIKLSGLNAKANGEALYILRRNNVIKVPSRKKSLVVICYLDQEDQLEAFQALQGLALGGG